jgi:hypothetical protein
MELLSHPLLVGPNGVPPGATASDVRAVERRYGACLPSTLIDWFSVVNGAFCGTQQFVALNDYALGDRDFVGRLWLPVAADGCGNSYLVDLTRPDPCDYPVFFWDHETDYDPRTGASVKGYAVASNVWIFSRLLLRKELAACGATGSEQEPWRWPFDRDQTLREDPDLARVTSAPLPWRAGCQN